MDKELITDYEINNIVEEAFLNIRSNTGNTYDDAMRDTIKAIKVATVNVLKAVVKNNER